jgi:phage gp36-like protein
MYITVEELDIPQVLLIQLTDDEQAGEVSYDRAEAAIKDAAALVDSYCSARYAVPFTDPVPPVVVQLTKDLSSYHLYKRRGMIPDDIKELYKNAMKVLADISRGLVKLGVEVEPEGPQGGGGVISGPGRTFGRDRMEGF